MIVLVETDPDEGLLIQRTIRACGVDQVRIVRTHEDAMEVIASQGGLLPRLILVDLEWGREDTLGLLVTLRTDNRAKLLPVIYLTDSISPERSHDAYRAGATAVLIKPVNCDDFKTLIEIVCQFWLGLANPAFSEHEQIGGSKRSLAEA